MMGRQSRMRDVMKWLKQLPIEQRDPFQPFPWINAPKRSGLNNPPRVGNRITEMSMQRRKIADV